MLLNASARRDRCRRCPPLTLLIRRMRRPHRTRRVLATAGLPFHPTRPIRLTHRIRLSRRRLGRLVQDRARTRAHLRGRVRGRSPARDPGRSQVPSRVRSRVPCPVHLPDRVQARFPDEEAQARQAHFRGNRAPPEFRRLDSRASRDPAPARALPGLVRPAPRAHPAAKARRASRDRRGRDPLAFEGRQAVPGPRATPDNRAPREAPVNPALQRPPDRQARLEARRPPGRPARRACRSMN